MPGRDTNRLLPEYKPNALQLEPTCSVDIVWNNELESMWKEEVVA
jgi:hypothetical protein